MICVTCGSDEGCGCCICDFSGLERSGIPYCPVVSHRPAVGNVPAMTAWWTAREFASVKPYEG